MKRGCIYSAAGVPHNLGGGGVPGISGRVFVITGRGYVVIV